MIRLHAEIDGPRPIVAKQNTLPGRATIGRSKYSALFIRSVLVAERRHIHQIWIVGVNADSRDGLRVGPSHVLPCLAGVGRFVNAVALHDIAAQLRLPHADIDDVGI
jgi:hypothetical protein